MSGKFRKLLERTIVGAVALTMSFISPLPADAASDVTVNLSATKQEIRGFGGINCPVWGVDLTSAQRETAFGNGVGQLGFSVLRIFVEGNKNNWSKELPVAKSAVEHGAIVFASPWNPPSDMTETFTRNGVAGQKRLRYDKYAAYAQHLNDFVKYMKDNGVPLYAISVQNEPDYASEWTWWTPQEMLNFMKNNAGSITGCKVIAPESFNYSKNMSDPILNDPQALANMDILGTHTYGTPVSNFPYPLFKQKGAGKELWMTEVYVPNSEANSADRWPEALDVATHMHNGMVEAEFQAYVWWYIRRQYGPMKEDGTISKRGYMMAHFSKFVRNGYVRVDATKSPATNVYVSAYKGDGKIVIVAINKGTSAVSQKFDLQNGTASKFSTWTTTGSSNMAAGSDINVTNGSFTANLPAQSVTTFVAGSSTQVETTKSAFDTLEAENYDSTNSTTVQKVGAGEGSGVGYIENGNYLAYKNVDFGTGAKSFKATVTTTGTPIIELRLNSPTGTLIGTMPVASTGGFNAYKEQACNISTVTGVNDLYLIFSGSINVDSFTFSKSSITPEVLSGDVNADGKVNVVDATMLKSVVIKKNTESIFKNKDAADMNKDGEINSLDYLLLKKVIQGAV